MKHAQNPIANLISVPLQNNWYFGAGKKSGTIYVGNIEPVIPIKLNDEWNLIKRTCYRSCLKGINNQQSYQRKAERRAKKTRVSDF